MAAEALAAARDGDMLALRREVARGAWAWRAVASTAAEVLVGPPRAGDEGAGAMRRLDRALAVGDASGVAAARGQVKQALTLIAGEAARRRGDVDRRGFAQALSEVAYELGLVALEATAGTPEKPDAVRADVAGLLDGIADGAAALADGEPRVSAAGAALAEVARRVELLRARGATLSDRASFVVETGLLGVAVRRLAAACNVRVAAPYAPRVPIAGVTADEQPISALTVPAPRRTREPVEPATLAAQSSLGERLFRDRRLSKGGVRACVDCHQPARAFTDGKRVPSSLLRDQPIARNTPTLLYAALSPSLFWDGRVITGEGQALAVLHSTAEMGLDDAGIVEALRGDARLSAAFARAFSDGLTARNVARALAVYEEQALVPARAPIDRFARGEEAALDAEARRGLDVFAGVARCARCHVPPSFGGSRPPDFSVPVYAVVGAPQTAQRGAALDGDAGRGAVTKRAVDRGAMRTPTVRNVSATAPYFHHGGFRTLEEVVALYDEGGGRGRGLAVDNQDPDVRPLHLTPAQRRELLGLLRRGLTDR